MDAPAGVTQEEGHIGFLYLLSGVLTLTLIARRIQPSLFLVDREVDFCVHPRINRSPLLLLVGHVFCLFECVVVCSSSCCCSNKNQNTPRPSEHPPQVEECLKV